MEYTQVNGYLIPNLTLSEQPAQPIGKYGEIRREFLRENTPVTFDLMLMEGTLYPHLLEVDKSTREQINQTMEQLIRQTPMPNRKTDPLGWAQQMNLLKAQAEEMVMPMLYAL